jgi:hypothetical protein
MTSEIKVDTISEQTSANGVTIDGLTIKDGNIIGDVALAGTTPTFTVGDGGAEDAALIFDGNAVDYYMALDDSADNLIIGSGSTVGSNSLITIDSDGDFTLDVTGGIVLDGDDSGTISFKDGGTRYGLVQKASDNFEIQSMISDGDIVFKGNDGGATITALTLDMSAAGAATFNAGITVNGTTTVVDDISISGATPSITLTDTDDNSDCMVYQAAGNLYLEADKNSEASGSFLRIAVDDLDMVHVYNGSTVFNESSRDQDFRVESNGNANRFKLDAGDDVIVMGTGTVEDSIYGAKPALQLTGTDFNTSAFSIIRNSADASSPNLIFGKSRSSDGNTVVQNGDDLGNITFAAADGTDQNNAAARIYAEIDGAPGANDTPGRLVFATTADGANSATERLRIDSSGVATFTSSLIATGLLNTVNNSLLLIGGGNATNTGSNLTMYGGADGSAGTFRFRNATTTHFNIAGNGDLTGTDTSIGSISDSRLKENITDFTYDVVKFKQFKPKTFDWKNPAEHNGRTDNRGFIAQEIAEIDDYWTDQITINSDTEDAKLISADSDGNHNSYSLKLGKKDAMYISVIQQLITRIEALEG